MRPASRSKMPMSTTWASKISWILSPTRSYIDCMSRFSARPCWTLLMIASSAARSSVSVSSRFVSPKSRAFSRATPMLDASVTSRRSSASLNPCASARSRLTTPSTRPPARIGTPSHDSAGGASSSGRPTITAPRAVASARVPRRSGCRVVITSDVSPGPRSKGSTSMCRPSSTKYGKLSKFDSSSYRVTEIDSTPKMRRIRSPTRSMIALKSSWRTSARPISLTSASSSFRCRVSSMARARVSAVAMWRATKVKSSRSPGAYRRSSR